MPRFNRRQFVSTVGGAAFAGIAGCTGQDGGTSPTESTPMETTAESTPMQTTATAAGKSLEKLGISMFTAAGGGWLFAYQQAAEFYCQDEGIEVDVFGNEQSTEKQINDIKKMINQDYDGIVTDPWETGGSNAVIEDAVDEGIPVFTTNTDASTDAVVMNVAFASKQISEHGGEKLIEFMREQKPDKDEYRVLNIRGALIQEGDLRSEGFKAAVDNHDDVVLADTINGKFARSEGKKKALDWFNANEPVDGFYSGNITMHLGALDALDQLDLLYPASSDQHITNTCMSSSPGGDQRIRDGFIDLAVGSEPYPLMPMAIRYMQRYLEAGYDESVLPEIGTTLTADDFNIPANTHKGVELWSEPVWAPAEVTESFGHHKVKVSGVDITKENVDAPWHWPNIWG